MTGPTREQEAVLAKEARRPLEVFDEVREFVATYESTIVHETDDAFTRGYDAGVDVALAELREILRKGLE